jgi:purine nucleosidase
MNNQIPHPVFREDNFNFPHFTKFIIDTDAGGDDAHAILIGMYMIKKYRPDAEIIGITCVSGNANITNVIKNV